MNLMIKMILRKLPLKSIYKLGEKVIMHKTFKEYGQIVIVIIIVFLAKYFVSLSFLNEVIILSIFVMSCNFLLGHGGLLSFGQPLYLGVGAYATACYLFYFGQNPLIGIIIGLIAGVIFALGVGAVIIKLRSDYFALVNAALNMIGFFLAYDIFAKFTNGLDGMWFLARINPLFGIDVTTEKNFFIFAVLIFLIVLLLTKHIMNSMFGTICLAAKTDEKKLRFLGYNIFKIKLLVFIYSSLLAALAGSLYAIHFGFVCPSMMEQEKAGEIVATVILGGVGTLFGPLIGSIIIIAAKDLTSNVIQHWEVIVGALLVILVLTADKGIIGLANSVISKYKINLRNIE